MKKMKKGFCDSTPPPLPFPLKTHHSRREFRVFEVDARTKKLMILRKGCLNFFRIFKACFKLFTFTLLDNVIAQLKTKLKLTLENIAEATVNVDDVF